MNKLWVDEDIATANTLQKTFYTDPAYFEASKEKIFACSWQWVAINNMEESSDNCIPFTLLDGYLNEPLLITKDDAGNAHCMSNVCTHRGAILVNTSCKQGNIRCP